MNTIDINSDLGESFGQWHMGDDARMLTVVSSANIACGFHAGDPAGMRATLKAAAANQVCCGAHVGYPDIQGFGRREMNMADDDLTASVIYQIGALAGLARAAIRVSLGAGSSEQDIDGFLKTLGENLASLRTLAAVAV